ncbi:hypothetical protein ABK040_002631 [Willaertia magna]
MLQQFYEEERKKKSNLTTSSLLFGGSSTSPVVDDAILNTANKAVSTASNWFGSVLEAAVNTFTLEEPTTSNNNKTTVNNIEVSPIPVKPNNIIANKTNKKKEKLLVDEIERGELNKIVVKPSNNSKSANVSSSDTKINKTSSKWNNSSFPNNAKLNSFANGIFV